MRTSLLRSRKNGAECFEMVSGCSRTERCYIQIRVDDGMRTWESRWVVVVFGLRRFFWSERIYGRFACTRRSNTVVENLRTKDRIQNSGWLPSPQAVMRSCPSTTSAGPIALRLEAEFQYTRIFNERPISSSLPSLFLSSSSRAFSLLHPFLLLLLLLLCFSSSYPPLLSCLFVRRFFVLRPYVFLFLLSFFRFSRYTKRRTCSLAKSPFCISPLRKRRPGRHVVAVRLESRIYC